MKIAARPTWLPYAWPILLLLTLGAVSLTSKGLIVYRYFHDTYVILDAMWRAALGQVPHIDFPSPIGQAYYWPFHLLAAFGDVQVSTLLRANALVAALVVALACLTLPRRLSPGLFAIAVVTAGAVAMTPRDLDGWFDSYSFLAPYNTWAWALVTLPALIAMVPPRTAPSRGTKLLDGLVLGVVLALLLYLKVTFAVPAVGFVVLGLLLRHVPFTTVGVALMVIGAAALGVEALAHNNLAYLHDLREAAAVNVAGPRSVRPAKLFKNIALVAACFAFFLAALWIWAPSRNLRSWAVARWRPILVVLAMLGASALIATQNHPKIQLALVGATFVAGVELSRRQRPEAGGASRLAGLNPDVQRWLGWAPILAVALPAPTLDAISITTHAITSRSANVCALPALAGIADDLFVKQLAPRKAGKPMGPRSCAWILEASPTRFEIPGSAASEYRSISMVQRLNSGVQLIRRDSTRSDTVLSAAFANPYPFLFRTRPPDGAQIWWDLDRNFNAEVHPDPDRILNSTTIVLQPVNEKTSREFWDVYGRSVERGFVCIEAQPLWRVWVKRGDPRVAPGTAPCPPDESR